MIIKPILDKVTNKPLTNPEVCERFYQSMKALRDGVGRKTEEEREQSRLDFIKICGNSEVHADRIMNWLEQIHNAPTKAEKQRLIEMTLLPTNNK